MAPEAYEEFTDRQRTRVVRRENEGAETTRPSIGSTQAFTQRKEGLFSDLSIAQVIAAAAAAATSAMLASEIGIAGSVIGAAVSSAVTVVSSQLYRHFLTKSAEKLKTGREVLSGAARGDGTQGHDSTRMSSDVLTPLQSGAPAGANYNATHVINVSEDATRVIGADATPTVHGAVSTSGQTTVTPHGTVSSQSGTRFASRTLQARAEAERTATQRKVVLFSVVSAVVVLVACVAAILIATAGEGLGTKTERIFSTTTVQEEAVDADTSDKLAADTDNATTTQTPATDTSSNSGSDSANSDNSDSGSPTSPSTSTDGSDGSGDGAGQSPDTGTGDGTTGDSTSPNTGSDGSTDGNSGASATQ